MIRKRPRKRNQRERAEDNDSGFPGIPYSDEPEITPWLEPTGIPGVYQSPAEPVDPTDCDRWPDSPYCGGIGLSETRLGLDTEFSVNPCEICVTITPTLFNVGLPPYTICKRSNNPECIPPQPNPDKPKPDYPPLPLGDLIPVPTEGLGGQCEGEEYLITLLGDVIGGVPGSVNWEYSVENKTASTFKAIGKIGAAYCKKVYTDPVHKFSHWIFYVKCNGFTERYDPPKWYPTENQGYIEYSYSERFTVFPEGSIDLRIAIARADGRATDTCDEPANNNYIPAPAPPYPIQNREHCCMACGESEELLRLIAKRLGTDNYPVTVPQSMLSDRGNNTKKIESLSEFVHWFILQFDALVGEFPLQITIEDNDPTKPGDQKEKIKIPNLAEGIAEVMGVALSANINTQTLINSSIRNLIESGGAKVHALEAKYIAQSIADYLAFNADEVKTDVTMAFTPNKVQLDEILQESEQKIPLYTYSDDRDFKDEMTDLLFAAAIIRAVHYRKLGGDIKGDLKARFKDLIKFGEKDPEIPTQTSTDPTQQPEPQKTDFDRFVEDVETGFMNVPGISDSTRPYGRPFDQRPKIRELGNTSDNTDAGV